MGGSHTFDGKMTFAEGVVGRDITAYSGIPRKMRRVESEGKDRGSAVSL